MSCINYDTSLDNKKFSDYEVTKYELEYGVKISKQDNKTIFKGNDTNIEKVKGILKRDIFLSNNPLPKVNSKEGSLSSKLHNLDYNPNYSQMHSNSSSQDLYRVRNMRF